MPPQTQRWPGTRAVLFVHGVGDAKPGDYAPLVQQVQQILGAGANQIAFYFLYYDQINQWFENKVQASKEFASLTNAIRVRLGSTSPNSTTLGNAIADFGGDVLWPVLIPDARLAVRAALLQQLEQIVLDGQKANVIPRQQQVSIICHSMGCFHVYEALQAAAVDPDSGLSPATWGFSLDNVIFMASPVMVIRSIVQDIRAVVPQIESIACVAAALSAPSQPGDQGQAVPLVKRIVSITGNLDPVGGYLMRKQLDWGYMNLPGAAVLHRPGTDRAGGRLRRSRRGRHSQRCDRGRGRAEDHAGQSPRLECLRRAARGRSPDVAQRMRYASSSISTTITSLAVGAIFSAALTGQAAGQTTGPPTPAAGLSAECRTRRTIGAFIDTLRAGAKQANLAQAVPAVSATLDSLALCFAGGGTRSLTLDQAAALFSPMKHAGTAMVARWHRSSCSEATPVTLHSALNGLLIIANGALHDKLQPSTQQWVDTFVADMQQIVLTKARDANQTILAHEAAKYGPSSPQLNLAEVGLNYAVQFIPLVKYWFLPNQTTGPTPNELVASYRTTDLTVAQSASAHLTGRVVSSGELGLRRYSFSPTCGQGPAFVGLFHPCTWSTGLFMMSPRDAPLRQVWGKDARAGIYLSLSNYHLGCTIGAERRCAFGLATHVLPYIF